MKINFLQNPMLNKQQNAQNFKQKIRSYFELCKPNVMYLAIFSALAGMFLGVSENPSNFSFSKGLFSIILISIGAGSAGAFNMYFEMKIDALMQRTSKRPLPSSRVSKKMLYILKTI